MLDSFEVSIIIGVNYFRLTSGNVGAIIIGADTFWISAI